MPQLQKEDNSEESSSEDEDFDDDDPRRKDNHLKLKQQHPSYGLDRLVEQNLSQNLSEMITNTGGSVLVPDVLTKPMDRIPSSITSGLLKVTLIPQVPGEGCEVVEKSGTQQQRVEWVSLV